MAAPSKNFTNITDAQIDADSPIDTTLLTSVRDSLVNVKEWLGNSYTAAVDHGHNGIDSKRINDADIIKTNAVLTFDDFLDPNVSAWTKTGTVAIQDAVNGVCRITSTTANGTYYGISQSGKAWKLSAGITITCEAKVKRVNNGDVRIGLNENAGMASFNNEIDFSFSNGGANWWVRTTSGGTNTTTDTGVAVTIGQFYTLKIVATPSSVLFYIDGVLKATHTTNIPSVNMALIAGIDLTNSLDIDYINCSSSGRM